MTPQTAAVTQGSALLGEQTFVGRRFWITLLLIILVGEAARAFHFNLATNTDEQQYVIFARQLTQDVPIPVRPAWSSRIVWGWTLNLWSQIWGFSLERISVLMFLLSAVSIVLVGLIGRRVFGPRAGLLAAAVQAAYPINIRCDVLTTPDSLAVPVMLATLWLFLRYLQNRRIVLLITAAALAGLLVGIKEYFCLAAPIYALGLWKASTDWRQLRKELLISAGAFLLAFGATLTLNRAAAGDPLSAVQAAATYSDRYLVRDASRGRERGALDMVTERFRYVQYLLFENGVVGGLLLAAGGVYLGFKARRNEPFMILAAGAVFAMFLSLMPFHFKPLLFVEVQPRYAMAFIPMLAIGAGGLLAELFVRLRGDRALYTCASISLAAALLVCLWLPNYTYDDIGIPGSVAVRHAIRQAKQHDVKELVFPWNFHRMIPDSWYQRGVHLEFAAPAGGENDRAYGGAARLTQSARSVGVFVPLHLEHDPEISRLERAGRFERLPVMAPGSSLRAWLQVLGKQGGGSLAGYLYVPQPKLIDSKPPTRTTPRRPSRSLAPVP